MRSLIPSSALGLLLAACTTPAQHDQVLQTLQNLNADVQIVAPGAKALLCVNAAGAVISGAILTQSGDNNGAVVSAGGAAVAQAVCPAGSTVKAAQ